MSIPSADSNRFVRTHLKTRHMVLLVELGRHGSIIHAAQAAGLTQPGASKLLGELEHVLGVPLFQRLPRGVEPTWYGQVLIRRAVAALAEMDAAHSEVMHGRSGIGGRVAVGTVLTPSCGLIPDAIKRLKARHHQVQVAVRVDTSKALIELMRAGELDIVVGRILESRLAAELNFEPLSDEPHSLIVRAGHPWAKRADLTLAELAGAQWILPPPGMLRDRIAALFIGKGLDQPSDTIETASLSAIPPLVMGSDMVVALPADLVRIYLDTGKLCVLPIELGISAEVYGIVTRRAHHLSPAGSAMLKALRESAGISE
jgi:DNA-binding transcriptional LysR family regulator